MPRIKLLTNDWSVDATGSSANEQANAGADRMLSRSPQNGWRTNNLTAMQATFDAGQALPWDAVFIGYTNGEAVATLRVTSDDNSGNLFTSPTVDSTPFTLRLGGEGRRTHWHAWYEVGATVTHRYIGIEIVDSGNPDGFFKAGIFYAGLLFEPSLYANQPRLGPDDPSIVFRSGTGESQERTRRKQESMSLEWNDLIIDDLVKFKEKFRIFGNGRPIVARRYYDDPAHDQDGVIYGTFTGRLSTAVQETRPNESGNVRTGIIEI